MNVFCLRSHSRRHLFRFKRYHTHGSAVIGKIDGLEQKELSTKELILKIRPYVWPAGESKEQKMIRQTVVKTGGLILTSKMLSLIVPICYKHFMDVLAGIQNTGVGGAEVASLVIWPFAAYAALYLAEPIVDQFKSYTFATVKQRTTRVIGKGLIEKLFSLDHRFHTNRETGALLKAVDRGNRAIATVLHATCIVFAPAVFQVVATALSIAYFCGLDYAGAMVFTSLVYARFSIDYTTYRTPFRIAMNKADMEAGNLATDSLLNYETVKFFGNERFEAMRYDDKLARYETAALKTDRTLATLNIDRMLFWVCV
jgi:ATP-binding cassette subfamily B (MDR/TAP) protein 7